LEERINLCSGFEECVNQDELVNLLKESENPVAYDGFEPSGRMHFAQGIMKRNIVNKLTKAGFTFIFWIADWFAKLNLKMDGDLDKIQLVGKYFIEVWKACGMDMSRVKFLWCSEEISKRHDEYWSLVLDIATSNSLDRIVKCTQIMGRNEKDKLNSSQILYPIMQCADIFFLGVDACQLGMDQRKVNMLARDYAEKKKIKPPIILSHHMLPGLKKGQEKMSKSDAMNALFMEDTEEAVNDKIKGAYCVEKDIENNPCLSYFKYIIFDSVKEVIIKDEKNEEIIFKSYNDLENSFKNGDIHPIELKKTLSASINQLLDPVRKHFQDDKFAKELLEQVKELRK